MKDYDITKIHSSLHQFINWLENNGETSYDHQSYFAGPIGGRAKALYYKKPLLGTIAVAPMIFCEAFVPSARRLFWKPMRFPIADAHYVMGLAFLSQATGEERYYQRAKHFLDILEETRCPGFEQFCWGYPFDWVTRNGTIPSETPLITTTPYVYEAFSAVYQIDRDARWLQVMRSIAEHAVCDIKDFEIAPGVSTCSYTPFDQGGVINASAYRAFLLSSASNQFSEGKYWNIAERNLNFVLQHQQADGSWCYAADSVREFIDHFHTCFVLKALAKIHRLTGHEGCNKAIGRGVEYFVKNLLDKRGLPKPFSKAPRLTVYRQELYDYAECLAQRAHWGVRGGLAERAGGLNESLAETGWILPVAEVASGVGQRAHASLGPIANISEPLLFPFRRGLQVASCKREGAVRQREDGT
jgi:hypothetical protein